MVSDCVSNGSERQRPTRSRIVRVARFILLPAFVFALMIAIGHYTEGLDFLEFLPAGGAIAAALFVLYSLSTIFVSHSWQRPCTAQPTNTLRASYSALGFCFFAWGAVSLILGAFHTRSRAQATTVVVTLVVSLPVALSTFWALIGAIRTCLNLPRPHPYFDIVGAGLLWFMNIAALLAWFWLIIELLYSAVNKA